MVGVGKRWVAVSRAVLAVSEAMRSYHSMNCDTYGYLQASLSFCIHLAPVLGPFAIAWWFLRREHEPGELQLTS